MPTTLSIRNEKFTIMKRYKFWRKFKGGGWYKHQFTRDANELSFPQGKTWWARYGKINRYSEVIETEDYTK